jgi:membrane-associated protein
LIDHLIQLFLQLIDFIIHIDLHLAVMAQALGPWLYVVLFAIVFAETGLIVTPILPGDSLLFAAGALSAIEATGLNVHAVAGIFLVAGLLGDLVNYFVGRKFGRGLFRSEQSRLFNRKYLVKTEAFFLRYGPAAVIIARFMPIVRTFAPFVAGMGKMAFPRYIKFCLIGGASWVVLFTYGGFWFGNLPLIKRNFHIAIIGVIVLSLLPMVIAALRARFPKGARP